MHAAAHTANNLLFNTKKTLNLKNSSSPSSPYGLVMMRSWRIPLHNERSDDTDDAPDDFQRFGRAQNAQNAVFASRSHLSRSTP